MAETTPAQSASGEAASLVANVQIVSPTVGVGPLSFPSLSASTTVRQLKEKIRETLASHPEDAHQRLIHRGRLLARDSDTLKDIFTEEQLRSGDQQTLHLVLRDIAEQPPLAPTPTQTTPLRGQSPAPGNAQQSHGQQRAHGIRGAGPGFPMPPMPPMPDHAQAGAAQQLLTHQQQVLAQQQQVLAHQYQQFSRSAMQFNRDTHIRQLLAQQQRERAAMGAHGIHDNNPADPSGGRRSPALQVPTQTIVREGVGPNGQYWRTTVSETVAGPGTHHPQPGGAPAQNPAGHHTHFTHADVANLMRGPEAAQATQAMTDAMHRSTSGVSLAGMANLANFNGPIRPIQPGVTTPIYPGTPRHVSRAATPDPSARPASRSSTLNPHQTTQAQTQSQRPPEVFILYSPSGPRGLLINGPSDVYSSPSVRPPDLHQHTPSNGAPRESFQPTGPTSQVRMSPAPPDLEAMAHRQAQLQAQWQAHAQQVQHQRLQQIQHQQQVHQQQVHQLQYLQQLQQQPQPQYQAQQQPQVQPQPQPPAQPQPQLRARRAQPQQIPVAPPQLAHPNNQGAGALMAAAWPHIWLVIRLIVFVWWFTSNDPSWTRWFTMVAIAIAVFVLNTGMLNGLANQAWDPMREHLHGLMHLAEPNQPQQNAQAQAAPGNGGGGNAVDPNPAQTAARLLAQRRQTNGTWLMHQVRRLERAGVLFLASIAPGVAEQHIARIEEEQRAEQARIEAEQQERERLRLEAEAAAAAASEQVEGEEGQQQHEQAQPPLIEI